MNVIILGPDPSAPYRNGGVAKYVEYQLGLKQDKNINVQFYLWDWSNNTKLQMPVVLRKYLGIIGTFLKVFMSARDHDVVHMHASLYNKGAVKNLMFVLLCKVKRIPLFLQIHGGRLSGLNSGSKRIWKLVFKYSTNLGLFPGPQYEEFSRDHYGDKLIRMANFVPGKRPTRKEYNPPHFLFLGRIVEEKGIFALITNFFLLRKMGIEARLTVAGDGDSMNTIKEMVDNSRYKNDVSITGYVAGDELESVMADCNIFVLPSWYEGFPLSFLECALQGMAPVITVNNGIPFFFQKDEDYLPVYLHEEEHLLNQLKRVAVDVELREKVGRNARRKVKEGFTSEAYLPKLIHIYQNVVASKED